MEVQIADQRGHLLLYRTLLIGHAKHSGVQRIQCSPFPKHPYFGANRQDLVFFRPPGVEFGAFVLSPDTVWYGRVLLLFSMKVVTDTGPSDMDCAMISVLETHSGQLCPGTCIKCIKFIKCFKFIKFIKCIKFINGIKFINLFVQNGLKGPAQRWSMS